MKKQLWALMLAVGLAGAMMGVPASGQQAGGAAGGAAAGGGGGGGGRRGGGNFDPAAFRQRMEDQMKADMGATDDEWKVLQPKIEAVQTLQQQSAAGRMGGFGGMGGGRRGRGGNAAGGAAAPAADANPVAKAAQELRALLVNDDGTPNKTSTDDQIKEKLKALRDAKAKAKDDLTAAQKDLQSVATVRQEAVLVSRGILE